MSSSYWNNRIVFYDGVFQVREVHYEDGEPVGHGQSFLAGDSAIELRSAYEQMQEAFNSPVLSEADFPNEGVS
jgi:hypothetical protein